MDPFWFILKIIGILSLTAVASFPLFLIGFLVYKVIYRQKRVQQADEIRLLEAAWLQLPMDPHGLTGTAINLLTGAIYDMDSGEWADAAHKLAALSGAQGYSKVATQVVEDEAPMVQLPAILSVPAQEQKGSDL